jgi:hypothetical protein
MLIFFFHSSYQKIRLHKIQWKQLRQSIHWDLIKGIVWHTNLEMKDKKYLVMYHMTYGKFMCLIRELKPFIKSTAIIFLNHHYNLKSYWVGVISICT